VVYLISYDLVAPEKDYPDLLATLRNLGAVKILLSEWVHDTEESASDLCNHLIKAGKLDSNDRILVVALRNNASWRKLLISDDDIRRVLKGASN
jgi:hypothetical protein